MDNDDMLQYLGGLSMAVRKESGKDPEVFVSMQRTRGQGHIESLAVTLGQELRSRYLNPTWIEGMKKESYVGVISIPGVLSPEIVEKFMLAVEQAAGRSLNDQVKDRLQLPAALKESPVKPDVSLQPDKANPELPKPDKTDPESLQPDKPADDAWRLNKNRKWRWICIFIGACNRI